MKGYTVCRTAGRRLVEPCDLTPDDLNRLLAGEHAELTLRPTVVQEGSDVAEIVSGFVNSTCTAEAEFVETMGGDHPTLQQAFTRLCLRWLYHMAEREHWDLRTEASVRASRKVTEALGDYGWQLPTI